MTTSDIGPQFSAKTALPAARLKSAGDNAAWQERLSKSIPEAAHTSWPKSSNILHSLNNVRARNTERTDNKFALCHMGSGQPARRRDNERLQGQVSEIKGQNVAFTVCRNALKRYNISAKENLPDVFQKDLAPMVGATLSGYQPMGAISFSPDNDKTPVEAMIRT